MQTMHKILAVARIEFRLGLRRGLPIVGMVLISGMVSLFIFWQTLANVSTAFPLSANTSSLVRGWTIFTILAPIILPIVTILAVPSDRDFGVFPWLFSQPLDGAVYLVGKVLGTFALLVAIWLACTAVHMLAYWIVIGPFNPLADLLLMAVSGLPILLWGTGVGVSVGALIRSRRPAILIGVLVGFASAYAWGYLFPLFASSAVSYYTEGVIVYENPLMYIGRNALTNFAMTFLVMQAGYIRPVFAGEALLTLLASALTLVLALGGARGWLAYHDQV
jgi:ABC-type transport system involved in multi-copper enzyme maturation permease subunit